jgi:hypothetical protein
VKVVDNSVVNSNPDTYNVARNSSNNALTPLKNDYVYPRSLGSLKISNLLTNGLVGTISLSGNSADNFLLYTPQTGFIGTETFAYEMTDALGNKGTNSITIHVGGLLTGEDEFSVLSDSSANSLDVLANDYLYPDATLLRNIAVVGAGDHGGTFTTNSTATAIVYTPASGYVGAEHFTYQIKDDSGVLVTESGIVRVVATGSDRDTKTVAITIVGTNDLPTITGVQSGIQITDKQTAQPFSTITIGDLDEHGLQQLTTTVSFDGVTGSLTNLDGFVQASSGVYVFHGTGPDVTTAIRGLRFIPVENRIPVPTTQTIPFTISVDDGYVSSPVVDNATTVELTAADDAPTIQGTIAVEKVYQYSSIRLFAGVTVKDVDDQALQPLTITVTINNPTHGNLTSLGGFVSLGSGVYRLTSATPAAATAALRNLLFVPTTSGRVSPGSPETTGFTLSVDDGFAAPVIDTTTTVVAIHEFSAKILAADGAANDRFGAAVATSRDTAVIGALNDNNEHGVNAGSAYVFVRNPVTEQWTQSQRLSAADGTASDYFGNAVAIDNDTIVVGAYLDGASSSGSAYVFRRTATNWTQIAKLSPFDGANNDQFGYSVAINQDVIAVGSHLDDDAGGASGSVYLYGRNRGGTDKWGLIKKITASDAAGGNEFGVSVDVRGDLVAVGATSTKHNGVTSGTAYLFSRNQGGTDNWGEIKEVAATDATASDHFGSAVALYGTNFVVGASQKSQGGTIGAAYIFSKDQGGADNWGQSKKLLPPLPGNNDQFGAAVSVYQDKVIIGSPYQGPLSQNKEYGSAYVFATDQGGASSWGLVQSLDRTDSQDSDHFGTSVMISSNTVVVGVPLDDDKGDASGSAYIYRTKYNNAPVVATTISNVTVSAGAPFTFGVPAGTFADVDVLDTLKLSAFTSGGPAWLNFDPNTSQFSGTPDAVGQYTISVVATDEDGASVTNSFGITVSPSYSSSLQNWRISQFGAEAVADPGQQGLWGDSADPDGDGQNNLMEYLFGTDPLNSGDSTLQISANTDGTFNVSYRGRSVVTYTLEASTDMVNWSAANLVIQDTNSTVVQDDLEAITCHVAPANPTNKVLFFRLSAAQ